jgi:hypothetical protein
MRSNRPPLLPVLLLAAAGACSREPAPDAPRTPAASTAAPDPVPPREDTPPPADAADRIESLVRADDTLASLQARLGAGNAVAETLPGAEGDTLSGWTLFPADPTRRLSVYLDDTGEHPMMLLAGEDAIAWTRADGVRIGMTSQQLAALNGTAFGFMGFDWDYGGVVTDWRGGRIAPDGASAGPVTLCPPETPEGETPEDYPIGDGEFRSDDARLLTAPAWVCEFGVNIDPPAPGPAG